MSLLSAFAIIGTGVLWKACHELVCDDDKLSYGLKDITAAVLMVECVWIAAFLLTKLVEIVM